MNVFAAGDLPVYPFAVLSAQHLFNQSRASLEGTLVALGVPKGGAANATRAAFARAFGRPVSTEREVSRTAALALAPFSAEPTLRCVSETTATDGTIRIAWELLRGGVIESVVIPAQHRTTLCISSQVGCARACRFCETGQLGLEKQLHPSEIVDQVRLAMPKAVGAGMPPLTNIVFMGMGEPFDNLKNVRSAVELLTDPSVFGLSPSRITVSTVGVVEQIPAFFRDVRAGLAVSLNAPDDVRRAAIMPIGKRHSLEELRQAILAHMPAGKHILFEYILFGGFNDSLNDARLLADYVRDIPCRVNVIPCNPGPDPSLLPPSPESLDRFVSALAQAGVRTLVRRPRGRDVGGACGQLAGSLRARLPVLSPAAASSLSG